MKWIKHNLLLIGAVSLGIAMFSFYTVNEYGYFCDSSKQHHAKCEGFLSSAHLHDWLYNASSNWQSDLLVGAALVTVLRRAEGPRGND